MCAFSNMAAPTFSERGVKSIKIQLYHEELEKFSHFLYLVNLFYRLSNKMIELLTTEELLPKHDQLSVVTPYLYPPKTQLCGSYLPEKVEDFTSLQ